MTPTRLDEIEDHYQWHGPAQLLDDTIYLLRLARAGEKLAEAAERVARSPQRNCDGAHDPVGSGYGGCDCVGDAIRAALQGCSKGEA